MVRASDFWIQGLLGGVDVSLILTCMYPACRAVGPLHSMATLSIQRVVCSLASQYSPVPHWPLWLDGLFSLLFHVWPLDIWPHEHLIELICTALTDLCLLGSRYHTRVPGMEVWFCFGIKKSTARVY